MGFMDSICETECHFVSYVKNYSGQNIIVYGAGCFAQTIVKYLTSHTVRDFHVCVDRAYFKYGQMVEDYSVECLETVFATNRKTFDIIVAFVKYAPDFLSEKIKKNGWNVSTLIYTDTAPHFWMKPELFYVPRSYYMKYDSDLTKLNGSLADDLSRACLKSFINQRISGNYDYSNGVLSDGKDEYFPKEFIKNRERFVLIDCGAFDGNDTKRFFSTIHKCRGGGGFFCNRTRFEKYRFNKQCAF